MEERLIDKFLKEYIQDLSEDDYDIPEDKIMDVVYTIEDNEHAWDGLEEAIYQEIEKFRKKGGEEDE